MSSPFPRRAVLTAGAAAATAAAATVGLAPAALAKGPERSAPFTLDAEVLDGGEQIVSVTIDATRRGGLPTGELPTSTFTVHARGTNPLTGEVAYDVERPITAVSADHRGRITVELEHGNGVEGAGTLGWMGDAGRNVQLDLEYTITQNEPLPLHGKGVPQISSFVQGDLVSPEVDAFSSHVSASGTNYRLFSPARSSRPAERPLIIWLHGGGEGGFTEGGVEYYDNESQMRANRGALGVATPEAQEIFGGAYVVAPQCPSAWMLDGPAFEPLVDEIIEEVAAAHPVDRSRVHVIGASNGGYMTLKMVVENPGVFASATPICGVVKEYYDSPGPLVPDAELAAISTPTWLIAAANDGTVDPVANTVHAHELIDGSILSLYDTVTWEGVDYSGHFSWIYASRNDPSHDGMSLWEWMAAQEL
ncbi:MAG: prolyl oligopeptidase family serine peptidase [Brachybacterium tyrofermentans]|uniref:prolyl oligopeptidase family serine peptidase n=1 Tax=Brachybacterium tyrofermentans TaxID=47848 RepID=UPI000A1A8344|nr:prolyl oligopeptidase family serine peptidase [Brachybacterium tyrofermentans]SLM99564.1 putative glucan-binding protein D; BglB-like protein [Corynebacterium xerosis]